MMKRRKWGWRALAMIAAVVTPLMTELVNTSYKVYVDQAPKFKSHYEIDRQCGESRVLGQYCNDASESLKLGFWHTLVTTTVEKGRWCLGQRCDELSRDVWTGTKAASALASTVLWFNPQIVATVLDLWRTRHVRSARRLEEREDRRLIPDAD